MLAQHSAEVARDTMKQLRADQVGKLVWSKRSLLLLHKVLSRCATLCRLQGAEQQTGMCFPHIRVTCCSAAQAKGLSWRLQSSAFALQEGAQGTVEAAARVVSLESKLKVVVAEVDRIQEQATLTARLQVRLLTCVRFVAADVLMSDVLHKQ